MPEEFATEALPTCLRACIAMIEACGSHEHWDGKTREAVKLAEDAVREACGEKRLAEIIAGALEAVA